VSPFTAARTLVERQLTATAALGITTVVAAGDTGSSACARGVSPSKLTSSDKKPQTSVAVGARRGWDEPGRSTPRTPSPRPGPGTTRSIRRRSTRRPAAAGGNALFGGSCCPARPGFDLATGWGSPLANTFAGLLAARG
jgi:hypothetical protein